MTTPLQQSVTPVANTRMAAPAVGRPWAGPIVAIAWLGMLTMGSVQAIDIPALPVVQPSIAAVNPALVQLRETLLNERKALLDRTNRHNQLCDAVVAGSAADVSCTKAYPLLEAAINSHIQASKQYNDNYLAAVNLAASQKPAPSSDPMVVDARNVPSGLPKALDNAIANAYASAPPGVSDRVRKGFQAVMEHDWKVAKAWFQDALKRDPNNAGLKRLVALTDTSQQPNKQPATVDARNEPAGLGGRSNSKGASAPPNKAKPAPASTTRAQVQLLDPNDVYLMFPGLKSIEDKQALDYLFGLNAQPSSSKSGKTK